MAGTESYSALTRRMLRAIERHRRGPLANAGCCRFSPSCSHYAEELFRTRAFPVALVMTVLRVLRCNPLAVRSAQDPVRRPGRWRPRPNTVPTLFGVFALSGIVVITTAGIAQAVGVTGGCNVTIRGEDPARMTYDNPLQVHRGEVLSVTGNVPPAVLASGQTQSHTYVQVSVIEGIAEPKSETDDGTGPTWGGKRNVDSFMDDAVGIYKVTGVSSGAGWRCDGSGYVELKDGNPLSKPVGEAALGVAVVGAAGAALSARGSGGGGDSSDSASEQAPSDGETPAEDPPYQDGPTSSQILDAQRAGEEQDSDEAFPKKALEWNGPLTSASCVMLIFMATVVASRRPYIFDSLAVAAARPARGRRVWRRGHPILGFISGLFLGVGVAVLGQQFAYWPLTRTTAIALPVFVAILCSIRGYIGSPRKAVAR